MSLDLHIKTINETTEINDAFDKFQSIMAQYGYTRVAYSLVTDHPSLGLQKQHGLISSYPSDWMKYYTEKQLMQRDPVVYGILNNRSPFYWDDLKSNENISDKDKEILFKGQEAGIKSGVGIPLFGLGGEIVGLGLASDVDNKSPDYEVVAQIFLLANIFHQKYRAMLTKPFVSKITQKEKDVLSWASESKTDDEIGTLMGISVNTVRYHWKNIFKKLEAYGRYVAISKAITMGLIEPRFVVTPYHSR